MAIVKKCRNSSYILQVIRSPGIFAHSYDHPFFGQLSLAGMLAVTDYPPDASTSISVNSIETLYHYRHTNPISRLYLSCRR